MNGQVKKGIGIGALTGLLSGGIAFLLLHLTLVDRFRGQGQHDAEIEGRVRAAESWIAQYETSVRPLRDQFIKFTGQLPGLVERMDDLKQEMRRLSDRLDRLEQKRPAAHRLIKDTP